MELRAADTDTLILATPSLIQRWQKRREREREREVLNMAVKGMNKDNKSLYRVTASETMKRMKYGNEREQEKDKREKRGRMMEGKKEEEEQEREIGRERERVIGRERER